jgi:hypothetical protein
VVADGQRAAYPDLRDMDFQQDSVGSYQGFDIRGGFFEGKMRSRASTERLEAHWLGNATAGK